MRAAGPLLALLLIMASAGAQQPTPKIQAPATPQQQRASAPPAPAAALRLPTPASAPAHDVGLHSQEPREGPWRFGTMELLTALTCGVLIFQSILMRKSTDLAAKAAEAAKQ